MVKAELAQMAYIRHGATNARISPPESQDKGDGAVHERALEQTPPKYWGIVVA
jgi:hypothetical protein